MGLCGANAYVEGSGVRRHLWVLGITHSAQSRDVRVCGVLSSGGGAAQARGLPAIECWSSGQNRARVQVGGG